jgi:protein-S-isoprenylcysteine O-methyltransferase Ste14
VNIVRDAALVVFFLWLCVDALVVFRLKTNEAENRDHFSLKLLMIGGPLAYAISISLAFGPIGAIPWAALRVAGLLVMGVGIVVRSTAIFQLGRFHTPNVAVRADHQLRETGLYRYVRHPSYLGALIAFLGFTLALGNWLSVTVMMCATAGIYLYRIHEEDAALSLAFGEAYRQYSKRTKRLIPWLY